MKKIFVILTIVSLLWLNGCYYSRYESVSRDYYTEDTTYYEPDPIYYNSPDVLEPISYPIAGQPVQSTPPTGNKNREGTANSGGNRITRPEANREANRNIDMTTVKVNRQNNNTVSVDRQRAGSNQEQNNQNHANQPTRNNNNNSSGRSSTDGDRGK